MRVGSRELELSRLDKTLFPESGLTKRDLIDYYGRIADTALPHYRDRPLTMQRFPDGIGSDGFFEKSIPDHFPDWIDRVRLEKQDGAVTYVVANEKATLVYLANQACITPHLGLARCSKPRHPDRLIFDLDPSDDDFAKVRSAALALRSLLDDLGLTSFVQTTGSRGLHVLVPLDRSSTFETTREFARAVAARIAGDAPDERTTEQRKSQRGQRVFIDCLRNAYGQTGVAPYAVRALERAPVATPLRWKEVETGILHPQKFTLKNIFRRLGQIRDPWQGIGRSARSLDEARERLGGPGEESD